MNFQTQLPHFPDDIPDSALCSAEEMNKAKELTTKHHKYPPSKRPNYDKLNTYSPFRYVRQRFSDLTRHSSETINFDY